MTNTNGNKGIGWQKRHLRLVPCYFGYKLLVKLTCCFTDQVFGLMLKDKVWNTANTDKQHDARHRQDGIVTTKEYGYPGKAGTRRITYGAGERTGGNNTALWVKRGLGRLIVR